MKIECNENVMFAVMAICLLCVFWQLSACVITLDRATADLMKAKVAAGLCADKFGTWEKCK